MWRADGAEAREIRPVSRLLALSRMQEHQKNREWKNDRRQMPEMRRGRNSRAPIQKRPDFFRLFKIPRLRFFTLEQADRRNLPPMQEFACLRRQRQAKMLGQRMRVRKIAALDRLFKFGSIISIRLGYSYITGFLRVLTKRSLEKEVFLFYNNFVDPGPL